MHHMKAQLLQSTMNSVELGCKQVILSSKKKMIDDAFTPEIKMIFQ